MSKFVIDEATIKVPKFSFMPVRRGVAYAENGNVKTYANKKQVENKVKQLTELGLNVSYTMSHPFLIIPID